MSLPIREPISGFSPLMEAAASGHEIIVQYLLEHVSISILYGNFFVRIIIFDLKGVHLNLYVSVCISGGKGG